MTNFFQYLFEVSIIFAILYVIYSLFLSGLTFHQSNRWTLLLLLPVSLGLPFLDLYTLLSLPDTELLNTTIKTPLFHLDKISEVSEINNTAIDLTNNYGYSLWIILLVYCIGTCLFSTRLLISIFKIYQLKKNSQKINIDGILVFASTISNPFSYFNWIFIPKTQIENISTLIVKHEATHVKLRHSIDLLITELFVIMFWFNPLVYFYRKSLKSIHEFQADQGVLDTTIKTSDYLKLILDSIQKTYQEHSYSYFNNPIIKKRIKMITKAKSKKLLTAKYLLVVLGAALLSVAFAKPQLNSVSPENLNTKVLPIAEPPSIFPIKEWSQDNITSTFQQKIRQPITGEIVIHQGIDIRALKGTPIIATADGIIVKADAEGDWGNLIVISHADGYQTRYAHLDGFNVIKDQSVKKGEVIGYVGNTGLSKGSHLHYEILKENKRLNPLGFIKE